jgi:ABC-2 type transport system permease protein
MATEYSAPRIFAKTVYARAYPRLVGHTRQLDWLFVEIALPLLGTIAMVYVYRALHAPPQYLGFAILGGAMMAYWQNVLWMMAVQFYWDRNMGTLEIYTFSPTTFTAVLLGMALGAIPQTTFRALVIVGIGSLLFGVSYDLGGLIPALGVFVLTLAALYGLGMLLASLFLFFGRSVESIGEAMQEPVFLLSGFYFPVKALGGYVGGASSLIPLTLGLDAMRQLILPGTPVFIPLPWEVLLVAVQVPVYAVAARVALAAMEFRARRDGRLITKGE